MQGKPVIEINKIVYKFVIGDNKEHHELTKTLRNMSFIGRKRGLLTRFGKSHRTSSNLEEMGVHVHTLILLGF